MIEIENPYICFNCERVGKCQKAILHTHDTSACKDFKLYIEVKFVRVSVQKLAEILGISSHALYRKIKFHGWEYVTELLRAKGIRAHREKSGALNKLSKKQVYSYYIKE